MQQAITSATGDTPESSKPRLKVLLSAYACEPHKSSEPGLGWQTAVQISRAHDVWVITSDEHRAPIEEELARNPRPNIHWIFVKVPHWLTFWKKGERGRRIHYAMWQIAAYFEGRRRHQKIQFDVIHHVTYVSYWTPNYLSLLPVPFVWGPVGGAETTPPGFLPTLSARGRRYERIRDGIRWMADTFDPFVRIMARRAKVGIATTKETGIKLKQLGTRDVRVMTDILFTPDMIETLAALPDRPTAPQFTVLSIGRLLDWKGFHLGLEVFARFLQNHPQAEYRIIGEGPQRDDLQAQAQELGIASNVKFLGLIPREQVMQNLAEAHVLLHPSLHETGGWVCTEAMAVGRPVVCLDLGGPGQQISAETGFAIEAKTPAQAIEDMAQSMLSLATDPELALTMGAAGRRSIWEKHNWDRRVELFSEIYHEVIKV